MAKLVIEIDIDPAYLSDKTTRLTGSQLRQGLCTIWDTEYQEVIDGKVLEMDLCFERAYCGSVRVEE